MPPASRAPEKSQIKTPEPTVPAAPPTKQPGPEPGPPPPPPPQINERSFAAVLFTKLLDTGDDVLMHAQRWYSGAHPQDPGDDRLRRVDGRLSYQSDRPVILILGSGWASHACTKVMDMDKFDIVVVSPRNHFVFTPMLPSTAVGSVEFRSLLEPVRVANPYVSYFEAAADTVDLKRKVARCRSVNVSDTGRPSIEFDVAYDYLITAVGEQPATFGVPGVMEHAFFMKEVSDSVRMRKRIQEQFERAAFLGDDPVARKAALRFVVVGGGPTGVEFAGTMSDFLFADLVKRYPTLIKDAEVVLIQSGTRILPVFDRALQDRALGDLERQRVRVHIGVKVTEVRRDTLVLSNGEEMGYGVCLWSAGNASRQLTRDFVAQLPEQAQHSPGRPEQCKLAVDQYMRIIGAPDAFAVGDCSKIVTGPLPATAQVAGQQGAYVARVINRNKEVGVGGFETGAPWRPVEAGKGRQDEHRFEFLSLGIMAYVGGNKAIMELDMNLNAKFWGQFAFLLWRSVYITKQVSMRNRILILFDWLKSRVFGRDISLF